MISKQGQYVVIFSEFLLSPPICKTDVIEIWEQKGHMPAVLICFLPVISKAKSNLLWLYKTAAEKTLFK